MIKLFAVSRRVVEWTVVPALVLTPWACRAYGAENPSSLLDEVVVVAPRIDERARKLGNAFTRLPGEELERDQIRDVKNGARLSPGVFVSGEGTEGGISVLSIRGNRPDHTLIWVDGVKANTGMFPNASPFLSNATTYNLESLEVIRGPFSPLFGSDAIAGVAVVETLRGRGEPVTTLFFEGGSFDTFREGILGSGSLGSLDYSFHYAHEETSNGREHNDFVRDSASLRLDWTVNKALTLGLAVRTQLGEYQDPVLATPFGYQKDSHYRVRAETTSVSAYADLLTTDIWRQRLTLGYFREYYKMASPPVPHYYGPEEDYEAHASNFSVDWQHKIAATEAHQITAGAAFLLQGGHDESFEWKNVNNFGIYLQDQWEVVKNLTLTAGGRFDSYQLSGEVFTYRFAGAYFLEATRTKFRGGYGTAFKAPSFFQLFSTSEFALGNPDLKPERSRGWDIGIDQYLLDDQIVLGMTFFQNHIRNLVAWEETSAFTGRYVNRDRARNYGIETSLVARLASGWNARVAYTWTESFETTPTGEQRIEYRPRNVVSVETSYRFLDSVTLGAGVYYVAQQEAIDWNTGQRVDLGDYTLWRLFGRYDWGDHLSVTARVENLFNERYWTRLDYAGLGRALYAGVEIRW